MCWRLQPNEEDRDVLRLDKSLYMGGLLLLPSFYYSHHFAFYTLSSLPITPTARTAPISHPESLICPERIVQALIC